MDNNLARKIKAGQRVFGNPELYYSENIKKLENDMKNFKSSFNPGEFVTNNNELIAELGQNKKQQKFIKNIGEYFLRMINNSKEKEIYNNLIFCNCIINDYLYDFVFVGPNNAIAIKCHNIPVTDGIPICCYDDDNNAYLVDKAVFELSPLIDDDIEVVDLIYSKNKTTVFNQSKRNLILIADFYNFLKETKFDYDKEEVIDKVYDSMFKLEETDFVKNAIKVIED